MRNAQEIYLCALREVIKHPAFVSTDGRSNILYDADAIDFVLPEKIDGVLVREIRASEKIDEGRYDKGIFRWLELLSLKLEEGQLVLQINASISIHIRLENNKEVLSGLLPHEYQSFLMASKSSMNEQVRNISIHNSTYKLYFVYECHEQCYRPIKLVHHYFIS